MQEGINTIQTVATDSGYGEPMDDLVFSNAVED